MLRYNYFRIRYSQWFKNLDGIKDFAQQSINWILRSTLRFAFVLKKRNKNYQEKINELSADLKSGSIFRLSNLMILELTSSIF